MELVELQPNSNCSGNPLENQIVHRELQDVSYNEFYWKYEERNCPIVLKSVSNDWECRRNWTFTPNGSEGKRAINFQYLRKTLNNCIVPISNCNQEYFNSHTKLEMRFHDFLDHWMESIQRSNEENSNAIQCDSENLYLKDWHLKSQMPDYDFYCVPKHFASDFLNEYLVGNGRDDYRFVYMGPKGSWTPFHADVFGSYSWSTNIIGCKKWLVVPPGDELKLMNRGNLPFKIDEALLEAKGVRYYTLFQKENEAFFVPSGWYHQVTNLTDTISVNHNFFNACNLMKIWENLAIGMRQVIAEIEDCRQMDNFNEHCQTMLRASFGINYLDFLDMLEFLAKRRLYIENGNEESFSDYKRIHKYIFNSYHIRYDLQSIKDVLEAMIDDTVVRNSRIELLQRSTDILESIKKDIN